MLSSDKQRGRGTSTTAKSDLPASVHEALVTLLKSPSLRKARALEDALRSSGAGRRVFGRINQKASLEANSESDRGIAERLANAFDASLTAARLAVGIGKSTKELTPRKAAQRFFSPTKDKSEWKPQDQRITSEPPMVEFWLEPSDAKVRYKRYHTTEGLCTVVVQDSGVGILREEMPSTILDLNSDSKLQAFEAIGQFGHGGSSSLAFCESALVITQPRVSAGSGDFSWTLIVPERAEGDSKQELVRYWFCASDFLPVVASLRDFSDLRAMLPGTAVWHFGYSRGGWIKPIAGPEQSNPWGRLGRLFFSYPLPFYVRGELARTDTITGQRLLKGAFFRLLESDAVEYASGERSESLILDGTRFGEFHVFIFALKECSSIRDYVDQNHPVIGTLNGQNHGEMTRTIISKAGLPELSTSTIIEARLDHLDVEAQGNIINNSREAFKRTEFTRELEARLLAMLEEDEILKELELARQEKKAREASADMSKRLSVFLSAILSDAKGRPGPAKGGGAPGKSRAGVKPLPEIPAADPPTVLEFLYSSALTVPEGVTKLAKFRSDARPPKYSFYGDNPRLFVELRGAGPLRDRVATTGKADLNLKGYGSVSISCADDPGRPITEAFDAAELHLTLQSASGRTLHAVLPVRVEPKPSEEGRRREPDVQVELRFSCPDLADADELKQLLAEEHVSEMGPELSQKAEVLNLLPSLAAYAGDRTDRRGESVLRVEINAANPRLRDLMTSSKTAEERQQAKERYCRDVVLDCYQHEFSLETIPDEVTYAATTHSEEEIRAAEIYLNHDKAIRFALAERERDRKAQG